MSETHVMNMGQHLITKVIKLSATVFFNAAILLTGGIPVTKQSGENLVNNYFFLHLAVVT